MAARTSHAISRANGRALVVGAMVLALAPAARGGLVPGGGSPLSDCYAELDLVGIENGSDQVKRNRKVTCVDGDPCDAGPCGDGVCDLQVRLCWNQHDPNVAECVAPPALDTLLLRGPLAAQLVMPRSVDGSNCSGDYVDLAVPTKAHGTRPGRLSVRMSARAPAGTTPPADTDLIRLVCVPRPVEECPLPTTTTTTSPPGGGTTFAPTTTVAGASSTSTTRTTTTTLRKPRKTTTTVRVLPTTSTTRRVPTTLVPTTLPPTTLPSTTATTTTTPLPTIGPTTTTTAAVTTTTRKKGHGQDDGLVISIGV